MSFPTTRRDSQHWTWLEVVAMEMCAKYWSSSPKKRLNSPRWDSSCGLSTIAQLEWSVWWPQLWLNLIVQKRGSPNTNNSYTHYIHCCTHTNFRNRESQFIRGSLKCLSEHFWKNKWRRKKSSRRRSTVIKERRGLGERGKRDHFGVASGDVEIDQDKL